MASIMMRQLGNIVELAQVVGRGPGGQPALAPLPTPLQDALKAALTYTHLTQLRGVDAYDEFGNYRPTRSDNRIMYHVDEATGRFCASVGWKYRFLRAIPLLGHTVEVVDLDAGRRHPRPRRYETDWNRVFEKMDLRVKQDEVLAAMDSVDHGVFDIPPGVGKTHSIAAYVLAHPHARVHVVTDGIDIINRIYRHLIKFVPNVGLVGGGKRRFGPHATVVSADSLHVIGEGFDDPASPRAADVVIFDEVHKAAAPSTLEQLRKYNRCRMYGLSGSVNMRFDGADAQLEGLFGEVVFSMSYQEAEALGLVAPVRVEWVKMDFEAPELVEKTGTQLDRWGLWRCAERNRRFAEKMLSFPADVQSLVMVATVEHAVYLKQYLPGYALCYDSCKDYAGYVKSGLLDPNDEPPMTAHRREQMRQAFEEGTLKKVIATDVWSTGVDFTALSVLGRADGRASALLDTQIPCRANRVYEGKAHATLVDCLDMYHDGLLGRSGGRKRNYVKKGWKQDGLETRRVGTQAARINRR